MFGLFRRRKPQFINGRLVRGAGKACPLCLATPNQWCKPDCAAVDVMDYR